MPRVQKKGSRIRRFLSFFIGEEDEEQTYWSVYVWEREALWWSGGDCYQFHNCTERQAVTFGEDAYRVEHETDDNQESLKLSSVVVLVQ